MYSQAWQFIRALPRAYGSFARENPNANAFALSVTSTVVASSITAALIDDKANNTMKKMEAEIKKLEMKNEIDLVRIKALEDIIDEQAQTLHKNELDLLDKSLRLRACKSDFNNAGIFGIFRRGETLPESDASQSLA